MFINPMRISLFSTVVGARRVGLSQPGLYYTWKPQSKLSFRNVVTSRYTFFVVLSEQSSPSQKHAIAMPKNYFCYQQLHISSILWNFHIFWISSYLNLNPELHLYIPSTGTAMELMPQKDSEIVNEKMPARAGVAASTAHTTAVTTKLSKIMIVIICARGKGIGNSRIFRALLSFQWKE